MKTVPIEGESTLVKDSYSHAILNTNVHELIEAKQRRKNSKQIQTMQTEINMLKSEIEKIKSHLNVS
jgi:hypothetical protein